MQDVSPDEKQPLRIVIVGHVDHGKSTLIGRLFHDTGSLPEGKLEQLQAQCQRRGVPFEWAFLMDALQAERDQNITIDTAQIWFNTTRRPYVIIDAPGHREFLKNMITGAASADAALLLIAADEGVQAQSKRHGYMLSMLGIERVAVLVNKMDLVDYRQDAFDQIVADYTEFLGEIGLTPERFVPISAREGDAIAETPRETMPWYDGPSVLETLDAFERPAQDADGPLRLPIQDIYRFDARRILAGRVESGTLREGDELVFWPGERRARVKTIESWSAPVVGEASAGASIGVTLDEQIFVERGQLATRAEDAPALTDRFAANIFWMGKAPLLAEGTPLKLKLTTQEVACTVERVESTLDIATLTLTPDAPQVERDDVARVWLRTERPVAIDTHARSPRTGRFVLVTGYDVAGGGIITRALETTAQAHTARAHVTAHERARRQRHTPALIWLRSGDPAHREALARELERALFDRDLRAYALDHTTLPVEALAATALHLTTAGLITLLHAPELGDPAATHTLTEGLTAQAIPLIERVIHDGDEAADHLEAVLAGVAL